MKQKDESTQPLITLKLPVDLAWHEATFCLDTSNLAPLPGAIFVGGELPYPSSKNFPSVSTTTVTKHTGEERENLAVFHFVSLAEEFPENAAPAAERINQYEKEIRKPSEERNLNLEQAAKRIEKTHGRRIHPTQIKRWHLQPEKYFGPGRVFGKKDDKEKIIFSEVECDSLVIPNTKPGRPSKKN